MTVPQMLRQLARQAQTEAQPVFRSAYEQLVGEQNFVEFLS
jgi:hypothetical protein